MPDAGALSRYETITVTPQPAGFGAEIRGVDLSRPLPAPVLAEIRDAWTAHSIVYFPDQPLTLDQLEEFTVQIGPFGHDPYVAPMPGRKNILEVRREPQERTNPFGGGWHSDWSFQAAPPSATILHAETIPPVGGDTLFADAYRAYDALSDVMKSVLAPLRAIHSATKAYGPKSGFAKELDVRSMPIIISEEADKTQVHPLVTTHPVSGKKVLFVNPTYTVAIEGMTAEEGAALLGFLFKHLTQDAFVYRHTWSASMLTMWDNRCAAHSAQGGYDGHLRVLHRCTVAGTPPRA